MYHKYLYKERKPTFSWRVSFVILHNPTLVHSLCVFALSQNSSRRQYARYHLHTHRCCHSGGCPDRQHPQLYVSQEQIMHMRILSNQSGAMSCISQALPASCNLNPQCICSDAAFISTISCCVSTACDLSGQQAALGYAKQICAPVGVTNLVSFVRTIIFPRPCSDTSPAYGSLLRRNCCIIRH